MEGSNFKDSLGFISAEVSLSHTLSCVCVCVCACVCVCVCTNECESVCVLNACLCCGTFIKNGDILCVCFQVDELYEAFCIQSRLREGASRMKQAFSSSPSSKGTKESIAEVNRRYKEYTEVLAASFSV